MLDQDFDNWIKKDHPEHSQSSHEYWMAYLSWCAGKSSLSVSGVIGGSSDPYSEWAVFNGVNPTGHGTLSKLVRAAWRAARETK